ncbi:MAG: insulinase family protein [Myxococcota bacterium]
MKRLHRLILPSLFALGLGSCTRKTPETPATDDALTEIVTNPLDHRDYAWFRLDNGMQAVVVSNPDVDIAAASVDVHVGQFNDPPDREGLAHFLEHMLFMGTASYPDVDGFNNYIESHGGGRNAGTGYEHTNYFFRIDHPYLEPALDRFAEFFHAPLLDPEFVDRERNAVQSEYSLKIKDEFRRYREVLRATTNPAHPFSQFSVGNLETLADRDGEPVYAALEEFYAREYSASRMTVAVLGREDVETLKAWVTEKFSAVPTDGAPVDMDRPPRFTADQLGVRIDIVPLAQRQNLELKFPVPASWKHYDTKPTSYISNLLGHEGEGSLFSYLRGEGWVESLAAGSESYDDMAMMTIDMELTADGFDHIDDITDACFQYIRLIDDEGVSADRYDEERRIGALNFQFREALSPARTVQSLSSAAQYHPPRDLLSANYLHRSYDEDLIRMFLSAMRPDNMRMIVVAPGLETDQVEPLYSVPYAMRPLDPARVSRWESSPLNPALRLPVENRYIAEKVDLKPVPADASPLPQKLQDDAALEIWHHHDTAFSVPRAQIRLELSTQKPRTDHRSRILNQMAAVLIQDSLQEFGYPLRLAGLGYGVDNRSRGMVITVSGYDEKLPMLFDEIVGRVQDFTIDEQRFALQKERMLREWRNQSRDRPISQSRRAFFEIISPIYFSRMGEGADILEALTVADLQAFLDGYFDEVDARLLVHGNLTADEAQGLGAMLDARILDGAAPTDRGTVRVRKVPAGETLTRTVDIDHNDSTIVMYYQGESMDIEEHARWQLIGQMVGAPFFNQLRTEQQLGYTVWSFFSPVDRVPGMTFAIQSPVAGPTVLQERIEIFLAEFGGTFDQMSDDEFDVYRQGLIAELTKREERLFQRSQKYADALFYDDATFDWNERLAAIVGEIERADLNAFYQRMVQGAGSRRIIVKSIGGAHEAEEAATASSGCQDTACVTAKLPERFERSL